MQRRTRAAVSAFSSNRFGLPPRGTWTATLGCGTGVITAGCRSAGDDGAATSSECRAILRAGDSFGACPDRTKLAGIRPECRLFTIGAECLNLPARYAARATKVQQILEFRDSSRAWNRVKQTATTF